MSRPAAEARVVYQSYVDPAAQAAYIGRLQGYLDSIAGPGVRYEVIGMSPPDRELHRLTELRCAVQAVRNAVRAAEAGAAAFLQGHFQDPALEEIRSAVDIPVVGLGEASMQFALSLGRRLALVTIDPYFIPYHREQVARYGLAERVVAIRAVAVPVDEWNRAFADEGTRRRVIAEFVAQARPLVAEGVEVIIPAGGLPALLLAGERGLTVDGAPVLNGVAAAVAMCEAAIRLHRLDGTGPSRVGTFALPSPAALAEFLGETGTD